MFVCGVEASQSWIPPVVENLQASMGKSSINEGFSTAMFDDRRLVFLATLQRHILSLSILFPIYGCVGVCDTGVYRKITFFFTGYMIIMLWDWGLPIFRPLGLKN